MRIDELTLHGFGKWERESFSFAPGLNLIYAENEAGKSTLLEAIVALLYGMKKDYLKKAMRRAEWQRYQPWSTQQYGGSIRYRLGSQQYVLERDLLTEGHRLFDAHMLRDLSSNYQLDNRKERNYLYEQLGLTRTLFEEVCRIKSIGIEHEQPMMESLHQLADQDLEGPATYKEIFQLLEQKKREIGKGETGKGTRLAIVTQQLTKAKQALDEAKIKMKHFRQLESEYRMLSQKIEELDSGLEQQAIEEHSREQLQSAREQALLSKQQLTRFLDDIAQLQVEEEVLLAKLNIAATSASGSLKPDAYTDTLNDRVQQVESEIKHCEEQAAQVDAEIARNEQLLPYFHELQQVEKKIERKRQKKRPKQAIAILLALSGIGGFFFLPWYYAAVSIVLASVLFGVTLYSKQEKQLQKKRQDMVKRFAITPGLNEARVRDALQSLIQQREALYQQRLNLMQQRSALMEQEQIIQQLKQLSLRKQNSLLQLEPIRNADRAFVDRWKQAYTHDDYDEEQMVEAWVHHLKKLDADIEQFADTLNLHQQRMLEKDALLRSLARVEGEMKNYEDIALAEKENQYLRLLEEKQAWDRKRDILDLAKIVFQETLDEWNQQIAPALNEQISEIFSMLTMGRYTRVSADPSQRFQLRVIDTEHNRVYEQHQLSKGTEQQLYFALRMALVKQYSQAYKLPIFLDDSFAHYDQHRLEQALLYLGQMAEQHQIFLFTCHARELQILQSQRIPFQRVTL